MSSFGFLCNLNLKEAWESAWRNDILRYYLILGAVIYLFKNYVAYRQHRKLSEKARPESIKKLISEEDFEKARLYSHDKSAFSFASELFNFGQKNYIILAGLYPLFWTYSGQLLQQYLGATGEIKQTLVYMALWTVFSELISLPFSLYSTFYIEKKHGFNKMTLGLYFADMFKGFALTAVLGGPFLAAFIWVIKNTGNQFYFAVWLTVFVFQLFLLLIFPTFIQPLFNKFEPLAEGSLRSKIEELAKKLSFPLSKIFVMDGSKRSSHSNAYFFGFFSKRIVIFDTLLKQSEEDEVCAILGHELGHWKCWHTFKRFVISQLHIFAIFYGFSLVINCGEMYEAFGFHNERPVMIGLSIFMGFLEAIEVVLSLLMNVQSRSHEFEADRFAVDLGYGDLLQSALIKLQVENKGNMNPDWMYSALYYSHPPLVERLAAIKAAAKNRSKKSQ